MTATGWSFEQIDASSMGDVVELLEYWQEEPPAHVILAARYIERKPKMKRLRSEDDGRRAVMELEQQMGAAAAPLPAHLRDMVAWATEQESKLKGTR